MSAHTQKKKAANRRRRQAGDATTLSATARCVLLALPITVAVGLLLLFITSAVLLATQDPNRYHTAVGLALLYLTAALGGAIATRLCHRHSPLLCGVGEAVLLLLFITVPALFLPDAWKHTVSGGRALLTRLLLLPASVAGALGAARQKKKRRHH